MRGLNSSLVGQSHSGLKQTCHEEHYGNRSAGEPGWQVIGDWSTIVLYHGVPREKKSFVGSNSLRTFFSAH